MNFFEAEKEMNKRKEELLTTLKSIWKSKHTIKIDCITEVDILQLAQKIQDLKYENRQSNRNGRNVAVKEACSVITNHNGKFHTPGDYDIVVKAVSDLSDFS